MLPTADKQTFEQLPLFRAIIWPLVAYCEVLVESVWHERAEVSAEC